MAQAGSGPAATANQSPTRPKQVAIRANQASLRIEVLFNKRLNFNGLSQFPSYNGFMPKSPLLKYLPTRPKLLQNRLLKPIAHLLHIEEIWHMNRRSVSCAFFIGLFTAFLPLPGQMIIAAVLAIATRCNLPISVALVWISNPLTIAPMFYFTYRLGAWLLHMELETEGIHLSFPWIWNNFGLIGWPLLFGSVVCGSVAGVTAFMTTRILWRFQIISKWRKRRERKRQRPQ